MKATPTDLGEDLRLVETTSGGRAEAWLWWSNVPELPGRVPGVIGRFSSDSPCAAAAVLERACAELRGRGCSLAVGPMDGSTWRNYRFVTEPGQAPPFFLEPENPPEWPAWWLAAGFAPIAEYESTASDDLGVLDPRVGRVRRRLEAEGVVIRPVDPDRLDGELDRIYDLSVVAFRENYLFSPPPRAAFVRHYLTMKSTLCADLILLAERGGQLVGFVFAVPDLLEAQRGEAITSVIVKTLALLPGRAHAGLGAVLLGEVHEAARRRGFTRVIHALMHANGRSRNLSARYTRTIRRYALFGRSLVS